jgi:hypothetical protein
MWINFIKSFQEKLKKLQIIDWKITCEISFKGEIKSSEKKTKFGYQSLV